MLNHNNISINRDQDSVTDAGSTSHDNPGLEIVEHRNTNIAAGQVTYAVTVDENGELVIENPYTALFRRWKRLSHLFWFGLWLGFFGSMLIYVGTNHEYPETVIFIGVGSVLVVTGLVLFFFETLRKLICTKPEDLINQGVF